MTGHVLDRPIWSSLATRHARFAVGDGPALRFAPDVSPFACARDDSPESLQALARLIGPGESVLLLQADEIALPQELVATMTAFGVQMVAHASIAAESRDQIVRLTEADAPEMLALATLTKPGPFLARTPMLGEFWGIKEGGALIAMAGERMKQEGFAEVSGVCTHPDHRGRGLARMLSAAVASRIVTRGETPYLHAYETNAGAIRLYESLGFKQRCRVNVAVVRRR
jgi:predicted GNAT family acetyltransferase